MPRLIFKQRWAVVIAASACVAALCQLPAASASTAEAISITNPGSITSYDGDPVRLKIHATETPAEGPLTYSAEPLPPGLSISPSTGLISGAVAMPRVEAQFIVAITVTDPSTDASAMMQFGWQVGAYSVPFGQVAAPMPSPYRGKCLGEHSSSHGAVAVLQRCDGSPRQVVRWTAQVELKVGGKCLTDLGFADNRPLPDVQLRRCADGWLDQEWEISPAGGVVSFEYGACLDSPTDTVGARIRLGRCSPYATVLPSSGMRFVAPNDQVTSVAGACLDAPLNAAGTKVTGKVYVDRCNGTGVQSWIASPVSTVSGGPLFQVGNFGCLAVREAATAPGSLVRLSAGCGAGATWQATANGELINPRSGLCLTGSTHSHGSLPEISTCAAAPDQRWTLPANPVSAEIPGTCLTTTATAWSVRTAVTVAPCTRAYGQQWSWAPDGTFRAQSRCLTIAGPPTADGTAVQLQTCRGRDTSQRWRLSGYELLNPASGQCLAIPGADPGVGTQLVVTGCGSAADTKWHLE